MNIPKNTAIAPKITTGAAYSSGRLKYCGAAIRTAVTIPAPVSVRSNKIRNTFIIFIDRFILLSSLLNASGRSPSYSFRQIYSLAIFPTSSQPNASKVAV